MSILALDARKRWEQRKAHAAGETFDPTVEQFPESKAALDVLWAGGRGLLTERQYKAGDWLRCIHNGAGSGNGGLGRIQGGPTNPVEIRRVTELWRSQTIHAAIHAANNARPGASPILHALISDYSLADICRQHNGVNHAIMRRRIGPALDALADYKYGCGADVEAWNRKAGAVA